MPDDDELLAALREALRARQDVPEWFTEIGRNAFTGPDIGEAADRPEPRP